MRTWTKFEVQKQKRERTSNFCPAKRKRRKDDNLVEACSEILIQFFSLTHCNLARLPLSELAMIPSTLFHAVRRISLLQEEEGKRNKSGNNNATRQYRLAAHNFVRILKMMITTTRLQSWTCRDGDRRQSCCHFSSTRDSTPQTLKSLTFNSTTLAKLLQQHKYTFANRSCSVLKALTH